MMVSKRQQVLLVDDEPQVLVALEDLLVDDFVVFKTDSADRAFNVIEQERDIAVVISDQRMPKLTGDQLLSRLRSVSDATRILITGFADLSAVVHAVNNGNIYAYITKPWDPDGLRATVHKAAERFRLAKELADERQLLHDLVENIPDGVYFKDRDLNYLRVNRELARLLDIEAVTLRGKTLAEVAPQRMNVDAVEREEKRILRTGEPSLDVRREVMRRGKPIWISETMAPVRDSNNDIIGTVGLWRDVTERIKIEEALHASEERYRSIVETTNDGVWILDNNLTTTFVNRQVTTLLAYDVGELLGRSILGLVHSEWREDVRRYIEHHESHSGQLEVQFTRSDGATVWVLFDSSPILDSSNQHAGVLATCVDITHRKRLEDQLRQAQKMEAVGRLAGGVAHDFNNILSVILTYSQLIADELAPGDPIREEVEEVRRAGERAKDLTRQLLAFSRQQVLEPRILDLNQSISSMEKMLRRLLGEDVELSLVISADLGKVRADQSQIEQIIMNLIVNARDAMPTGGKVAIETANVQLDEGYAGTNVDVAPGPYVRLSVTDTGTGMDAETQKRIFEPFFTTKEQGKGTGLGLSMVFGIVKQSGGHVWVHSEIGHGTTFKVDLPRVSGNQEDEKARSPRPSLRGRETILVVEDESQVRSAVRTILHRQGYNILEAQNGGEAILICESFTATIHLLLTDVVMPLMSGRELAERLVVIRPEMRVLYMSGHTDDTIIHHGVIESGTAFFQKPITPRALARKVREVLDSLPRPGSVD